MPNTVHASKFIKKVVTKKGPTEMVSFATKTDAWRRTSLADSVQKDFAASIAETNDVPSNASSAILAETEHKSDEDRRLHFTAVWADENGDHLATKHIKNGAEK